MSNNLDLERLVDLANEREPSDIFLKVGQPPMLKIKGKILSSGLPKLTEENIQLLLYEIELFTPVATDILKQKRINFNKMHHDLDFAYRLPKPKNKISGLRINAFWQSELPGMVIRTIGTSKPKISKLSLPPQVKKLLIEMSCSHSGLILVTGPTGSGKSTTLAAMVNHLRETPKNCHILTIEDPIERKYEDMIDYGEVKAIITSREIETDVPDMEMALKSALRQAPNAILIGEIRDKASMQIALEASQTGHLVFATLHTLGAVDTINRVTSLLADSEGMEDRVRKQLAGTLVGIVSQRFIKRAYTEDEILIVAEVMKKTKKIREILENIDLKNTWGDELKNAIHNALNSGMQTFDDHLEWLVKYDMVDKLEAIQYGYSG